VEGYRGIVIEMAGDGMIDGWNRETP